ncbi:protein phosphatase 2C domain-containing protein [Streptomyces sp. NBC_00249]|uniref:PP2C family protein-serine/threonine phosphatase n=1 Tax=Streptomyces sp. NBC_00249 TaxID=2975690 RepID=UPI002251BEDC|nr:protein phosphatase 2C domain-containing protein [Streptomyces sp. NBC_00249]MCX5192528.1 protein phosphatase 2C domain-containing protein [Streptomyces sp. NBC_00249]
MPYIAVTALSHAGLVRDHNEDSLAVGPWTLCGTVTDNPQTLLFPYGRPLVVAVADGLGGHPAGEVASELVVRRLSALGHSLDGEQALGDALEACNRAVYAATEGRPDLTSMGTTVAGILLLADSLLVFNIGDSKVYAVGPQGGLRQVSVDDSPPLPPGRRTTSAVTQVLGGSRAFGTVVPHVAAFAPEEGARYLVCSDGLTDPVPDEVIEGLLRGAGDDRRAAFALWKAAIEAGGPDNITLALVRAGGSDEGDGDEGDGPARHGPR